MTPKNDQNLSQPTGSIPLVVAVRPAYVVGIGGSAGSLGPLIELLAALPHDTGMAFVIVQHLSPDHESYLVELLAKRTCMPVLEVKHRAPVTADHVYVIPPGKTLTVASGELLLAPRPPRPWSNKAIDIFLQSLALERCERAVAVILSGGGCDGAEGCRHIRAIGGTTFVQDASAEFPYMPQSVRAAECADFVLSPKAIATALVEVGLKFRLDAVTA